MFIFCHFCFFNKFFGLILQLEWTSTHQCTSWTVLSSGWLEWTSSHQCTSWGWGSWSRFGDEPKTHRPCPKFFFPRFFSAPKIFPPTYLPPTYLPLLIYVSPLLPPTYLSLHHQTPRVVGAGEEGEQSVAGAREGPSKCLKWDPHGT